MREAIRALDLTGLLDVRHGSGVYVAEDVNAFFSTSLAVLLQVERVGITEVLDLRALLGGYSARRAAKFATEAEMDRMAAFLDACDAPVPEDGPREMVGAAVSFQLAVSAAARNPLLFAIEGFLIKLISQLQLEAQEHHGRDFWIDRVGSFRRDRRQLLQSVRARDGDGAVGAMQTCLRTQFAQFSNNPELAAPDTVLAGLTKIRDLGLDRVMLFVHMAELPHEKIMASLELLAREVLPAAQEL